VRCGSPDSVHCSAAVDSAVLHCTVLYCTLLHCNVQYCTALHCTVPECTVLHCTSQRRHLPYSTHPCTALSLPRIPIAPIEIEHSTASLPALSRLVPSNTTQQSMREPCDRSLDTLLALLSRYCCTTLFTGPICSTSPSPTTTLSLTFILTAIALLVFHISKYVDSPH
jgi:hypothetical protein